MANAAIAVLRKAVKGLLYMSEKDAPFKVLSLKVDGAITKTKVAELLGQPADSHVEEVPFAQFFAGPTKMQKWHAEDEKAVAKRYQDLVAVLRESLTGLKVFKIGSVKVKVFVLGKTEDGGWVGLETDSLET